MLAIDTVVKVLEDLKVEPEAIARVSSALQRGADLIDESAFMNGQPLTATAFGGSGEAEQLGHHHLLAREVIRDTLDDFMLDLLRFADGAARAVAMVTDADTGSMADLQTQREAVETLESHLDFTSSDRNTRVPGTRSGSADTDGVG